MEPKDITAADLARIKEARCWTWDELAARVGYSNGSAACRAVARDVHLPLNIQRAVAQLLARS